MLNSSRVLGAAAFLFKWHAVTASLPPKHRRNHPCECHGIVVVFSEVRQSSAPNYKQ